MNLFDDIPDLEPEALTAGDLWAWTRSDLTSTYPTDTYTLRYTLFSQSSTTLKYDIVATKVDDAHKVRVPSATTNEYRPGDYQYQIQVMRDSDSEVVTLGTGFVKVLPAFTTATTDIRSHARKVLDAINATIEKTATKEQASYSVAGRSLSRRSIDELMTLRDRYQSMANKEQAAEDRANGKTGSRVLIKMGA